MRTRTRNGKHGKLESDKKNKMEIDLVKLIDSSGNGSL
jgi:hypothetical protein